MEFETEGLEVYIPGSGILFEKWTMLCFNKGKLLNVIGQVTSDNY